MEISRGGGGGLEARTGFRGFRVVKVGIFGFWVLCFGFCGLEFRVYLDTGSPE